MSNRRMLQSEIGPCRQQISAGRSLLELLSSTKGKQEQILDLSNCLVLALILQGLSYLR